MKKLISIICALTLVMAVFSGCGNKNDGKKEEIPSGKLKETHEAVKKAYGEAYYPNLTLNAEEIDQKFDIEKELYKEAIAEVPKISVNVDTFVGIEAAEGKAEEVEKELKDYREDLIENSRQYPMNKPKVDASEVYRKGNYVFFLMLGEIPMEIMDGEDEEAKVKAAKEQNKIAIEAIEKVLK